MRDLLLFVVIFGSLPVILFRPYYGILVWAWIGFMNPHQLGWSTRTFPFAMIVAIAIALGMLLSGRWRMPPLTKETVLLALFTLWMQITTIFAVSPDAWAQWGKVFKIQLMVFVTMMVVRTLPQLRGLIWVTALSIAFYGVKGGAFTITGGGEHRVFGPDGGFIEGNNEIGLALLMVIPLMWYLQSTASQRWLRLALLTAIVLCVIAVLGTHSRGAAVGMVAMVLFLVGRSKHRFGLALLLLFLMPAALSIMPDHWYERMESIRNYRQDGSAMGRLNSWQFAFNLARHRPLGGGFETFVPELFARYAPDPASVKDAHSIYFEVMAEHGFIGLALFLSVGIALWFGCARTIRRARDDPDLEEYEHLLRMVQVSFVAYAVSGAFLGLAYFDLFYNLIAFAVIAKVLVAAHVPREEEAEDDVEDRPVLGERLAPSRIEGYS